MPDGWTFPDEVGIDLRTVSYPTKNNFISVQGGDLDLPQKEMCCRLLVLFVRKLHQQRLSGLS